MRLINRDAVILRAKEPFLEWLHSIPEIDVGELTLDELNKEATIVLIPEMADDEQLQAYLRPGKVVLLEQELEDWCDDQAVWPRQRTGKLFDEWFELEYHSLILDTVEEEGDEEEE